MIDPTVHPLPSNSQKGPRYRGHQVRLAPAPDPRAYLDPSERPKALKAQVSRYHEAGCRMRPAAGDLAPPRR
jgi:hypothetical protein